jgi:hypothetical protein
MNTTRALLERADLACEVDDLIADLEVPVLTTPQRQGDVSVWSDWIDGISPVTDIATSDAVLVPAEGVQVVRGEATGNTHMLLADGPVRWLAVDDRIELGVLIVAAGAVAHLIHTDEHAAISIGPGSYRVRGKRERRDEIVRVAD